MPDTTVYNGFIAVSAVSVIMVISILTPMTTGKLIQQRAVRRQLTAQDNSGGQPRITMKLTAVVVAYLTLISLPSITVSVTGLNGINIYDVRILHSGVIFAILINHSTNFLLYNFFDGVFRKKGVSLFGVIFAQDKTSNMAIELSEMKKTVKA